MSSTNTFTPGFPNQPWNVEQSYHLQVDELTREIKKLRHEWEKTNRLIGCFICFARLREFGEHGGALGIDYNALLLDLKPRKRNRRKHGGGTIFDDLR